MGFSYRKSFKAGPFRITASKSGISYSAGVKGARITKRANGRVQTTLSAPGTGLRYTSTSGTSKRAASSPAAPTSPSPARGTSHPAAQQQAVQELLHRFRQGTTANQIRADIHQWAQAQLQIVAEAEALFAQETGAAARDDLAWQAAEQMRAGVPHGQIRAWLKQQPGGGSAQRELMARAKRIANGKA